MAGSTVPRFYTFNQACVYIPIYSSDLEGRFYGVHRCVVQNMDAQFVEALATAPCSAELQDVAHDVYCVRAASKGCILVNHLKDVQLRKETMLTKQNLLCYVYVKNLAAFEHAVKHAGRKKRGSNERYLPRPANNAGNLFRDSTIWVEEALKELYGTGMIVETSAIQADPRRPVWFFGCIPFWLAVGGLLLVAYFAHVYVQDMRVVKACMALAFYSAGNILWAALDEYRFGRFWPLLHVLPLRESRQWP